MFFNGVKCIFSLLLGVILFAPASLAQQQGQSAQDIFNALSSGQNTATQPQAGGSGFKTRGLGSGFKTRGLPSQSQPTVDPNGQTRQFLNQLPTTRGLSVVERKSLKAVIKTQRLPRINVNIPFAYDSAQIAPQAIPSLQALATALLQPSLASDRIALNGHTDAHGNNGYNQSLSERRALAVRNYLVSVYGVHPSRLVIVGYGEETPINQSDPFAPENRRVAIVNLSRF